MLVWQDHTSITYISRLLAWPNPIKTIRPASDFGYRGRIGLTGRSATEYCHPKEEKGLNTQTDNGVTSIVAGADLTARK